MYIHNIPAVFYNYNPLINKIHDLCDRGYTSNEQLFSFQKNELVSLVMEALGDEQGYALFDTDEFSESCNHFKNYLTSKSLSDLFKFTTSLENSAFSKYEHIFAEIFNYVTSARSAA